MLGSWCGKVPRQRVRTRPALAQLAAVQAWQADPSRGLVETSRPTSSPGPSLIERGAVSVPGGLAAEQGLSLSDLGLAGLRPPPSRCSPGRGRRSSLE